MSQKVRNPVVKITMYAQNENGFMAANAQTFYGLGAQVGDYPPVSCPPLSCCRLRLPNHDDSGYAAIRHCRCHPFVCVQL